MENKNTPASLTGLPEESKRLLRLVSEKLRLINLEDLKNEINFLYESERSAFKRNFNRARTRTTGVFSSGPKRIPYIDDEMSLHDAVLRFVEIVKLDLDENGESSEIFKQRIPLSDYLGKDMYNRSIKTPKINIKNRERNTELTNFFDRLSQSAPVSPTFGIANLPRVPTVSVRIAPTFDTDAEFLDFFSKCPTSGPFSRFLLFGLNRTAACTKYPDLIREIKELYAMPAVLSKLQKQSQYSDMVIEGTNAVLPGVPSPSYRNLLHFMLVKLDNALRIGCDDKIKRIDASDYYKYVRAVFPEWYASLDDPSIRATGLNCAVAKGGRGRSRGRSRRHSASRKTHKKRHTK